ncbi:MAG: YihY family inner membrane protein [Uliginosibacterium sp.]|nr:YihY family inner membrane protein [Uliginosibacterium sp.]
MNLKRSKSASVRQFFSLVRRRFLERRVLQTAGSLTYTTLLSLVPMVTVVLLVMRQFAPLAQFGDDLRAFLLQNLLPERAGKMITLYALQFSQKASSLTLLGTVFLVITAVMLFQTIDHTLNGIWNVRRPRAWYVRIPVYWLALTVGPMFFAASVAATGELLSASRDLVEKQPHWVNSLMDRSMTTVLLAALFSFMFHAIPNRKLNIWHSLAGGLVAGLGVVISQRLFGLYLSKLPSFALIYGTFSVVPIFLIWIYLSWLMVLLGATIAAVLPDFQLRHSQLPATAAGRAVAILRVSRMLADAQQKGAVAELADLARAAHQTVAQTDELLNTMGSAGWVVQTEDGAWTLCVAAEVITLGSLFSLAVFERGGQEGMTSEDSTLAAQLREKLLSELRTPLTSASGAAAPTA